MKNEMLLKELKQAREDLLQYLNLKSFVIKENDLQKEIEILELKIKDLEKISIKEIETQTIKNKEIKKNNTIPLIEVYTRELLSEKNVGELVDLMFNSKLQIKKASEDLNKEVNARTQTNYHISIANKKRIMEILDKKRI